MVDERQEVGVSMGAGAVSFVSRANVDSIRGHVDIGRQAKTLPDALEAG